MNKICLYPGTFDPITNGHLDIINRACKLFDNVIIAVAKNDIKNPKFDIDTRKNMLLASTKHIKNLKIITFDKLLVDLAHEYNCKYIIRGLRAVSDFEYELQMGYANSSLDPKIETVYLMPSLKYAFISSSIVRSILSYNGDISALVPTEILEILDKKRG